MLMTLRRSIKETICIVAPFTPTMDIEEIRVLAELGKVRQ